MILVFIGWFLITLFTRLISKIILKFIYKCSICFVKVSNTLFDATYVLLNSIIVDAFWSQRIDIICHFGWFIFSLLIFNIKFIYALCWIHTIIKFLKTKLAWNLYLIVATWCLIMLQCKDRSFWRITRILPSLIKTIVWNLWSFDCVWFIQWILMIKKLSLWVTLLHVKLVLEAEFFHKCGRLLIFRLCFNNLKWFGLNINHRLFDCLNNFQIIVCRF